jgi:nucleoside-diphosphate-sugar epimerase
VTGANGFLGGHVVEEMLRHGYDVHAAVRDPDAPRVAFLKDMKSKHASAGGSLTLYKADNNTPGSLDDAVAGCSAVIHVASPVMAAGIDPLAELVTPAVEGTKNAVRACVAAGVGVLVVTSSVATMESPSKHGVITERDHNDVASLTYGPYSYSKVQAEKALKEAVEQARKGGASLKYATVHPTLIIGPQQNSAVTSSQQVLRMLATREYPMMMPMHFDVVDVRDVARAHRVLAEKMLAGAAGVEGRFLVNAQSNVSMAVLADVIRAHRPDLSVPSLTMPMWLVRALSYFDRRLDSYMLDAMMQPSQGVNMSHAQKVLGFKCEYTMEQSVQDAVDSFEEYGIVKGKH